MWRSRLKSGTVNFQYDVPVKETFIRLDLKAKLSQRLQEKTLKCIFSYILKKVGHTVELGTNKMIWKNRLRVVTIISAAHTVLEQLPTDKQDKD